MLTCRESRILRRDREGAAVRLMLDSRGRLAGWQGWQASSIADMLPVWAQDICHGGVGGRQLGLQCFAGFGIEETFHDLEDVYICTE